MNQFVTPLKDMTGKGTGQPKSIAQQREGDWVCLHCNNLNFSFRKKCNRCKLQTREDNERLSAYYYHCSHYYYQPEKENFPSLHSPAQPQSPVALPSSFQDSKGRGQTTPCKNPPQSQLPSVSPLVKRYKWREPDSTEQSKRGLFEDGNAWASIDLTYFQEPLWGPSECENGPSDEMEETERIIDRIML